MAAGFRLGLVKEPDPLHEQFEGWLSIPFITPTGVVYMRFRCLEDHDCKEEDRRRREVNKNYYHSKYDSVKGEATHLYNVQALHEATDTIAIIEGELDAAVSTNLGLPAVGVPGANNWKPFHFRLFDDFPRVIVIGDGDQAGRTFATTVSSQIEGSIARPMPRDTDVTSYVVEFGAEAFLDLMEVKL